jgi:hypothetical protein
VQERNQKLITELKRIMQNDATGLTQFRAVSGEYQQGLVTPMQYYQVFQALLDAEHFPVRCEGLFLSLISLLPSEDMRGALHAEYAREKLAQRLGLSEEWSTTRSLSHSICLRYACTGFFHFLNTLILCFF